MIVRIVEEGQFELPDSHRDRLAALDEALVQSVNAGDDKSFERALHDAVETVRSEGTRLPADHLGPSELALPPEGASREEVEALLRQDGLMD